jgi:hypothetical protein
VTWEFTELEMPGLPVAFVECRIHGFGRDAVGLGDAFTFKGAATKALAEAWERLWMERVCADGDRGY